MAEAQNLPLSEDTGLFRHLRRSFYEAGQDSSSKPPAQNEDMFELIMNVLPPSMSGVFQRRWGYSQLNSSTGVVARRLYEYQKDSDGSRRILATASDGTGTGSSTNKVVAFNEDGTVYNSAVLTPSADANDPRVVASRDIAYIFDGVDAKKWDGSSSGGVSKTGIAAPATAVDVGSPISGSVTLSAGRKYYLVFENDTTGHFSGLSPVSATTGPLATENVQLTSLEISGDSQVTKKRILATADGGDETTLYELTQVDNSVTTFTDDIPEETLLTHNIYLETDDVGIEHGVSDNDPPPANLDFPTKHKGRIFGVIGQLLYCTKSLDELLTSTGIIAGRYEESWPADNQIDISEGAETVRGLLSDGEVLWIGTERHVRRLLGDSPQNFQQPEVAFNEVGILNQETWKAVFVEGMPIGVMWLTPDFKVIGSDFNTYRDAGTEIQDVLDSINESAKMKCSAMYIAHGNYDLYVLAIPTGSNTEPDTLCVYDLKGKKWYIWIPTDAVTAQLFNIPASGKPQALFFANTTKLYKWDSAQTQDRVGGTPVSFACEAISSWQDLGDSSSRKALNEIEIIGDDTMTVSVDGASTSAEFTSPTSIDVGAGIVASPFGELKLYLAGKVTRDRFYRFTFSATSTEQVFLAGFNIEAAPLHRI